MEVSLRCPNIKSKKWIELEVVFGELDAYKHWIRNQFEIPSVDTVIAKGWASEVKQRGRFDDFMTSSLAIIKSLDEQLKRLESNKGKMSNDVYFDLKTSINEDRNKIFSNISSLQREVDVRKFTYMLRDQKNIAKNLLIKRNDVTLTPEQVGTARKIINFYKDVLNFTPREDHPLFTYDELEHPTKEVQDWINAIKKSDSRRVVKDQIVNMSVDDLDHSCDAAQQSMVTEVVQQISGNPELKIPMVAEDIGKGLKYFSSPANVSHPVVQAIYKLTKKAEFESVDEINKTIKQIQDVIKPLGEAGRTELWDHMNQTYSNTDKRHTNGLTSPYTYEYENNLHKAYNTFRSNKATAAKEQDKDISLKLNQMANDAYIKDMNGIADVFDINYFFPEELLDKIDPERKQRYTQEQKDAKRLEVEKKLGEKGFERVYKSAEKKALDFIQYVEENGNLAGLTGEDKEKVIKYDEEHNPIKLIEDWHSGESRGYYPDHRSLVLFPKNDSDYDEQFKKIEADDKKYEVAQYLYDKFKEYKDYTHDYNGGVNGYSDRFVVGKNDSDVFASSGILGWGASVLDKGIKGISENDRSQTKGNAGQDKARLHLSMDINQVIKPTHDKLVSEFTVKNGVPPTPEQSDNLWRDASDIVNKTRLSNDMEEMVIVAAQSVIKHRYTQNVLPLVQAMYDVLSRVKSMETNMRGEEMHKAHSSNPVGVGSLKNTLELMDNYISSFMGKELKKDAQAKLGRALSTEEKKTKKALLKELDRLEDAFKNGKIDENTLVTRKAEITQQIAKMGRDVTVNKVGRGSMYAAQKVMLTFNASSALFRIVQSTLSGLIEGSASEYWNNRSYIRAYSVLMNSFISGKDKELVEAVAKAGHVSVERLNEISTNLASNKTLKNQGWKKYADGLILMKKSEHFIMMVRLIAMLGHYKLPDGTTYLDAFDRKTGEIKGLSKDEQVDFWLKTHRMYDRDQGDYRNSILYQNSLLGSEGMLRKRWMPEWIISQIGGRVDDYTTNTTMGGKVRALAHLYKMYADQGLFGYAKATGDLGRNILLKLIFQPTDFNKIEVNGVKLDEVDVKNMRRNMTQIMLLLGTIGVVLALKAMISEDEKDEYNKMLSIFWLNKLNQMSADFEGVADPSMWTNLVQNGFPVLKFYADFGKFVKASANVVTGGDDEIHTGSHVGGSKLINAAMSITPGLSSIKSTYTSAKQITHK